MAWTNLPLTLTTFQDIQDWQWLSQFWYACRERTAATGQTTEDTLPFWPPPNLVWSSGTIGTVTDNGDGTVSFSFSDVDWSVAPESTCSSPRWVDYTCSDSELCYLPSSYDLIIEGDIYDPYTVVRGFISGETFDSGSSTGTLTCSDATFKNAITAGFIPSLTYLEGKNYYIIKAGGVWACDRWLTKPNYKEAWVGTVDSGQIDTSVPPNGSLTEEYNLYNPNPYITDTNPLINWSTDQWGSTSSSSSGGGYQCMAYTSDGYLHRLTIIGNDSNTLYFGTLPSSSSSSSAGTSSSSTGGSSSSSSSSTLSLTGNYAIVATGAICDPNRPATYPFQFYGGLGGGFVTHTENDSIGTSTLPVYSATWNEGDPEEGSCAAADHECNTSPDCDYMIELDNACECGSAGDYLAPQLYATFRQLQVTILGLGSSYTSITWDGTSNPLPILYAARLFNEAGINAWTSGGSYIDSSHLAVGVSIVPPFYPYAVYYEAIGTDSSGVVTIAEGQGSIQDSGTLSGSGFSSSWVSCSVYLSYGFTRYFDRTFRYLYRKTFFLPDCNIVDGEVEVGCADPAYVVDYAMLGCLGVGQWIYRPISNTYSEYGNGFVQDVAIPFVTGELARFNGDSTNDPFSGTGATQETNEETPYWDHSYRGKHKKLYNEQRLAKLKGTATDGNLYSLTDTTQSWWTDQNGSGVARTLSSTATGGTTTSLIDSTMTSGANACFWQLSRYVLATYSWQGFYLEITKASGSSSSSGVGGITGFYKVPITGCDPSTGTLYFAAVPGLTVASGDSYEIKEPGSFELNTFQGRWLKIIPPTISGSSSSTGGMSSSSSSGSGNGYILITGNDDTTLYFAEQPNSIQAGSTYQIIEYGYGTTWEFSNTAPTDDRNYVPITIAGTAGTSSSSSTAAHTAYWVQPVGADGRTFTNGSSSSGGPFTFTADQTAIQPTTVRRYGLLEKGDFFNLDTYNELWATLNRLRWVAHYNGTWVDTTLPNTRAGSWVDLAPPFQCFPGTEDGYALAQQVILYGSADGSGDGDCTGTYSNGDYYFTAPVGTGYATTTDGPPYLALDLSPEWWWTGCNFDNDYDLGMQTWYKMFPGVSWVAAHMDKWQVPIPEISEPPAVTFYNFGATSTGSLVQTISETSYPDPPSRDEDLFFNGGQPVNLNQWTAWSTVTGEGLVTSDELGTMTPPPFPNFPGLPDRPYPCMEERGDGTIQDCTNPSDEECPGAATSDSYTYGFTINNVVAIADYTGSFIYLTV